MAAIKYMPIFCTNLVGVIKPMRNTIAEANYM